MCTERGNKRDQVECFSFFGRNERTEKQKEEEEEEVEEKEVEEKEDEEEEEEKEKQQQQQQRKKGMKERGNNCRVHATSHYSSSVCASPPRS